MQVQAPPDLLLSERQGPLSWAWCQSAAACLAGCCSRACQHVQLPSITPLCLQHPHMTVLHHLQNTNPRKPARPHMRAANNRPALKPNIAVVQKTNKKQRHRHTLRTLEAQLLRHAHCSQRGQVAASCSHTACAVLQHPSCVSATAGTQQGRGMHTPCDCSTLSTNQGCTRVRAPWELHTHTPPLPTTTNCCHPEGPYLLRCNPQQPGRNSMFTHTHSLDQHTATRCCVAACQPARLLCPDSHSKRLAAPAAVCSVGVVELEAAANQSIAAGATDNDSSNSSTPRGAHGTVSTWNLSTCPVRCAPLFAVSVGISTCCQPWALHGSSLKHLLTQPLPSPVVQAHAEQVPACSSGSTTTLTGSARRF